MLYRVKSQNGSPGYKRVYKQNVTYFSKWEEKDQNKAVHVIVMLRETLRQGTMGLFLRETVLYREPDKNPTEIPCYELLLGDEKVLVPVWHLEPISDEYMREMIEKLEEQEEAEQENGKSE